MRPLIALSLWFGVLLTSCAIGPGQQARALLIGQWQHEVTVLGERRTSQLSFSADGTFLQTGYTETGDLRAAFSTESGTWTLQDNTLEMHYQSQPSGATASRPKTDIRKITKLSDNEFVSADARFGIELAYIRPSTLVPDKVVGHLHYYKGTVVLEGSAERRTDQMSLEINGDNLCFTVSGASRARIPREGDQRVAWFCFSERDAAIHALRLPGGPAKGSCGYRMAATVVVNNYVANRQEADVFDTASLLAVKRRGPVISIPCD